MSKKEVIINFTNGETKHVSCRDCGRVQNMKVETSYVNPKIWVRLTFNKERTRKEQKKIKEEKMNKIIARFKKNRKERRKHNGRENN